MVQGPSQFDRLDGVNEGISKKAPCRVATTAPITLSGLQTIDSVTVAEGDRVLVREQTDETTNGVYDASSGDWTRSLDFNGNRDFVQGTMIFVTDGSQYIQTMWQVVSDNPITIDEDDIEFAQWSGGGGFPNATYWTVEDESADLPNSREIVEGTGIDFTDAGGGNTLTVAVSTNIRTAGIFYSFSNGGSVLTSGTKVYIPIPFACTIIDWTIIGDQSGSIVIDIWKDVYANAPPTIADVITASDKPTMTTAQKATGSSLTGWTTSIAAGDVLALVINSVTTLTRADFLLKVRKT